MDIIVIFGYDLVGEIIDSRNRNINIFKFVIVWFIVFCLVDVNVVGFVGLIEELRGIIEGCRGIGKGYCDIGEGFLVVFEVIGEVLWGIEREFGGIKEENGFGEIGEVFRGIKEGKGLKGLEEVFGEIKDGLECMKEEFWYMRGRILSIGEFGVGFLEIKLFDFSMFVELNDMSSFYEVF